MIRLVAVCGDFLGEQVLTTGYATFEFEDFTVCPSSELARVDPASCFWLEAGEKGIPAERLRALEEQSGQFVYIEGKVGCSKHLFAGYLEEIQLIMEVETAEVLWTTDPTMKAGREQR